MTLEFVYENGQHGMEYDQGEAPMETDDTEQGTVNILMTLAQYENVTKDISNYS